MTFRASAGLSLLLLGLASCDCYLTIPIGDVVGYTPVDLPVGNEIMRKNSSTPYPEIPRAMRDFVRGLPTDGALRKLENAGFKCVETTCLWMHIRGRPARGVTHLNVTVFTISLDASSSLTDAEIHALAEPLEFTKH